MAQTSSLEPRDNVPTGKIPVKAHSHSNPWLENLKVRLFSVTVRTMFSGTRSGTVASISGVTRT